MTDVDQLSSEASRTDALITPHTFLRIARRLPRLRRCQLYFVHVVHSLEPTLDDTEDVFLNDLPIELDMFHIFGSSCQETGPFLELLSSLCIDRLELELVTFVQGPNTAALPLEPRLRQVTVRDLWIDLDTADDAPCGILSALSSALSPDTLEVFHCLWQYWDQCAAVGSFLRNAGRSITDLALDMSVTSWVEEAGDAIQPEDWNVLNLTSCPNMRTFRTTVCLPLTCSSLDVANVNRSVTSHRHLFSLLPHTVRTVVIYMSYVQLPYNLRSLRHLISPGAARDLEVPVDYSKVEDILLELPRLEKVIISIRGTEILRQGGAEAVPNAFPGLHAKGILKVQTGGARPAPSFW
ncbi:hypothetical protein GY45DRAFT_1327921 [Cubamyces sp. BRFM 1775]|nr:hypothetical protein GY45DRAFT_1327921 [Cubamyces sp. BRFM 1775]